MCIFYLLGVVGVVGAVCVGDCVCVFCLCVREGNVSGTCFYIFILLACIVDVLIIVVFLFLLSVCFVCDMCVPMVL